MSWPGEGNEEFYSNCSEEGVISSWTFFWLVGGEVTGSQHHQPSNCNWPGVSVLVGSIQLPFPTWWGFSISKTAQRYCCVYHLRGNQDPAPRLHCCFLAATPLSLSVISNYLNLLFGTQEKGMEGELSLCFLQTRKGGTQKWFCAQEPHGILLSFKSFASTASFNICNSPVSRHVWVKCIMGSLGGKCL